AEVLYKAMKGLGTDEDAILQLLTARSNAQRQEIKAAYKTLHGKDLVDNLMSELGGKFESLIATLMTPPIMYEVTCLRDAIKVHTNNYRASLTLMLVVLLQASRQQGIQEDLIQSDAQALFVAGEQKYGTDEGQFITILGNRSNAHLRRVFEEYRRLSGYEIEESIQRETSGTLQEVLLAVVKCARSVPGYFADSLYGAMKGAGTDDQTLIRIMVSRSEVDMLDIRAEFRKRFATSLHKMIQGDTSGDYRKALLLLCGGDDA
uniref:Annexin n=1 Tax=Sinocyclocheilus anshuiensis TaxID=1608454 RepID=A0A671NJE5_9TELE